MSRRKKPQPSQIARPQQKEELPTSGGTSIHGTFEERRYISQLPNPNDVAKLELLHPGTARIVVTQFEKQSNHRMAMEDKVITGNVRQ